MQTDKMIDKMKEKAEVYEKSDVEESKIIDMESLEDFYNLKGTLFFIQLDNTLMKKNKEGQWFRYKIILNADQAKTEEIIKWMGNFKNYVDENFKQIYKSVDIILNKLEELEERMK